jgi:hypothetical protein
MVDREELRTALRKGDVLKVWIAAREYLALLDADALVIEKVDGEWPEWARTAIRSELWKEPNWTLNSILDALAKAAKDG